MPGAPEKSSLEAGIDLDPGFASTTCFYFVFFLRGHLPRFLKEILKLFDAWFGFCGANIGWRSR